MIQCSAQVMPTLDPDMGERLGQALRAKGIDLHVNETVQGFVQKDGLALWSANGIPSTDGGLRWQF